MCVVMTPLRLSACGWMKSLGFVPCYESAMIAMRVVGKRETRIAVEMAACTVSVTNSRSWS